MKSGLLRRIRRRLRRSFQNPTFVLIRILGNDLPPRHVRGQTLRNVCFILDNEADLPHCKRYWVLNRIADGAAEAELTALLEERHQAFVRIPFCLDDYARVDWDLDFLSDDQFDAMIGEPGDPSMVAAVEARVRYPKIIHAINNNGARNFALDFGRPLASIVLPWDGNCFLTPEAWEDVRAEARERMRLRYLVVPMARLGGTTDELLARGMPEAVDEPQIGFHRDAIARFNEELPYGHRPKDELLSRLGVKGVPPPVAWDPKPLPPPPDAKRAYVGGRVARLPSGNAEQEIGPSAPTNRGRARDAATCAFLDDLDVRVLQSRFDPVKLGFYDRSLLADLASAPRDVIAAGPGEALLRDAAAAERGEPVSVVDKTSVAPSGDRHDYVSLAPYWWPDPNSATGLPYIRRDGQFAPATARDDPRSAGSDKHRLGEMMKAVIASALAWRITGREEHAAVGAAWLSRWFLDSETRMNPDFRFAQVRLGHAPEGTAAGMIEIRNLVALLDAIRLLGSSPALTPSASAGLSAWLSAFAGWLRDSPQGKAARHMQNNIGTFYEALVLAIAIHSADFTEIAKSLRRARARIIVQFAEDGSQPRELSRTRPAHYCLFNLCGWATIITLASRVGDDLWRWRSGKGRSLRAGFDWVLGGRLDVAGARVEDERERGTMRALEAYRAGFEGQPVSPSNLSSEDLLPYWQFSLRANRPH